MEEALTRLNPATMYAPGDTLRLTYLKLQVGFNIKALQVSDDHKVVVRHRRDVASYRSVGAPCRHARNSYLART